MSDRTSSPIVVVPVPAFQDNYLWLILRGSTAAVVDPGDAAPIEATLASRGATLTAIVLTHHHADHIGGVAALAASRPGLPIYGPLGEAIAGVTQTVQGGERVTLEALDLEFEVLDVPGHTRGHIAYYTETDGVRRLFCGDTLFGCGCGRLFEGTAAQMQASLARIADLPSDTLAYCAHEYTMSNIRFALAVEPDNPALQERAVSDQARRERAEPTVPFSLALERATNPFLRWDSAAVKKAAAARAAGAERSPVETFAAIRAWKDHF